MIKTVIKVAALGVAVAATAEVLRRTGVVQKAADLVMEKLVHIAMEDPTDDEIVTVTSDGMYR